MHDLQTAAWKFDLKCLAEESFDVFGYRVSHAIVSTSLCKHQLMGETCNRPTKKTARNETNRPLIMWRCDLRNNPAVVGPSRRQQRSARSSEPALWTCRLLLLYSIGLRRSPGAILHGPSSVISPLNPTALGAHPATLAFAISALASEKTFAFRAFAILVPFFFVYAYFTCLVRNDYTATSSYISKCKALASSAERGQPLRSSWASRAIRQR